MIVGIIDIRKIVNFVYSKIYSCHYWPDNIRSIYKYNESKYIVDYGLLLYESNKQSFIKVNYILRVKLDDL